MRVVFGHCPRDQTRFYRSATHRVGVVEGEPYWPRIVLRHRGHESLIASGEQRTARVAQITSVLDPIRGTPGWPPTYSLPISLRLPALRICRPRIRVNWRAPSRIEHASTAANPTTKPVESTASPQMIGRRSQFDIGFRGRSGRRTLSWIQRLNCRTGGSICSAPASLTETCCVNKDCTCLISSSLIVWPMPG
jgi:hypothetical protein